MWQNTHNPTGRVFDDDVVESLFHDKSPIGERISVLGHNYLVIGTFAEDGPEQCSGLPVARYRPSELSALFAASFAPVVETRREHRTPTGGVQPFSWVALRRDERP